MTDAKSDGIDVLLTNELGEKKRVGTSTLLMALPVGVDLRSDVLVIPMDVDPGDPDQPAANAVLIEYLDSDGIKRLSARRAVRADTIEPETCVAVVGSAMPAVSSELSVWRVVSAAAK